MPSSLVPTQEGCSTAHKAHEQMPGLNWAACLQEVKAAAAHSKMAVKGCTKPSLSSPVSGFSVVWHRHQPCSANTDSHAKSPAKKGAASAIFLLISHLTSSFGFPGRNATTMLLHSELEAKLAPHCSVFYPASSLVV